MFILDLFGDLGEESVYGWSLPWLLSWPDDAIPISQLEDACFLQESARWEVERRRFGEGVIVGGELR
jgi:hypothetical protein